MTVGRRNRKKRRRERSRPPLPPIIPTPPPGRMPRMINAGFGFPLGKRLMRELSALGLGIRQDMPWESPTAHVELLLGELRDTVHDHVIILAGWMLYDAPGVRVDYSVYPVEEIARQCADVARHAKRLGVADRIVWEIGNEEQMGALEHKPEVYAERIRRCYDAIRLVDPQARIAAGSTPGPLYVDRLRWIREIVKETQQDIIIAVHPYRSHMEAYKYDAGVESFCDLVREHDRQFAVSEVGWHTAPWQRGRWPCKKTFQWTDDEVAAFAAVELRQWADRGAEFFVWFQLNDGHDPKWHEHRYGIRYFDETWKPNAYVWR